jgi:hypothetical protein
MGIDYSIARWVSVVPAHQWAREDSDLSAMGGELPEVLRNSRPLSEVHRLDLALFVAFEEAALRVSGALTRRAPTQDALNFSAQQTLDEARHLEVFRKRFEQSCTISGHASDGALDAILTPPLKRFLERCYEVADGGSFTEGLTLMNLVLEGMAFPLYAYEERYWQPVDPFLGKLVHHAYADESRHCAFGAQLVRSLTEKDPAARARVSKLCAEAAQAMEEIFRYYVKKFVGLFDAVAKRHGELFSGAECAPGHLIASTPYQDQVAMIHRSITEGHTKLLERAGLN